MKAPAGGSEYEQRFAVADTFPRCRAAIQGFWRQTTMIGPRSRVAAISRDRGSARSASSQQLCRALRGRPRPLDAMAKLPQLAAGGQQWIEIARSAPRHEQKII